MVGSHVLISIIKIQAEMPDGRENARHPIRWYPDKVDPVITEYISQETL